MGACGECLVQGVPGVGGGGAWSWGGAWSQGMPGRGVPGPGGLPGLGDAWSGGGLCGDPPMATAVGSMHPTGIHSMPLYQYLDTTSTGLTSTL